jgi:hypothetical protein
VERYTIFEGAVTALAENSREGVALSAPPTSAEKLQPVHSSRDLEAIFSLLADRLLYATASTGAMIVLQEDVAYVCRATAGDSAIAVGGPVAVNSGPIAECLRSRITATSTVEKPALSCLATPILRDTKPIGAIQLSADRTNAYSREDVGVVERIARLIVIALEDAVAAAPVVLVPDSTNTDSTNTKTEPDVQPPAPVVLAKPTEPEPTPAAAVRPAAEMDFARLKKGIIPLPKRLVESLGDAPELESKPALAGVAVTRRCSACGFPVSGSRLLCLDCEAAGIKASPADLPLSHLAQRKHQSWFQAHIYTIGTVLVSAGTLVLLILYWK